MVDILAFAAHPDDVELTMGGTILSLKNKGFKIGIIDFTKGELSTKGNLETRKIETDNATELMQLDFRENLNLGDGVFSESKENRDQIIDIIRTYKPKILFAPYKEDRHPDHERCSRMVREANFYSGLQKYITKIKEHHRALKVYYYMGNTVFEPTFVYDISDTMEKKLDLVKAYGSQFYNPLDKNTKDTPISRPEFMEYIRARARFFGERSGVVYGEAFYSEEVPAYSDFPEIKKAT